ncbi:MAG: hypothetical protein M1817_003008 [Caeruleum heppii]|nr:MAG: hypothetical protein M1817_003008 [Caeruleum heppii]
MLAHESGRNPCGKLSPELFETYMGYKKDTKTVIDWLATNVRKNGRPSFAIDSIFALRRAADIVRRDAAQVPVEITFALEDTIKARTRLTRCCRNGVLGQVETAVNASHEFFTNRDIHALLCRDDGQLPRDSNPQTCKATPPCLHAVSNRFDVLSACPVEKDHLQRHDSSSHAHPLPCGGNAEESGLSDDHHLLLVDDELSRAIELSEVLNELRSIYMTTNEIWEEVGSRSTSIVFAAFATNAAFKTLETIECRLCAISGASDPRSLQMRYDQLHPKTVETLPDGLHQASIIDELQQPWAALCEFGTRPAESGLIQPKLQRVTDYVHPRHDDCAEEDRACLCALLENMRRLIVPSDQKLGIVARQGTPLYEDVRRLGLGQREATGIRCAFGLRLLLSTCQCHTWTRETGPTRTNCRVEALRFAEEAILSIRDVLEDGSMPCRCCRTLAFYLEFVKQDLESFTKETIFDLFSQAPWVAGSQMLEMLEATFYYGLKLCSYRHYVGAVLHAYNVMVTFGHIKAVPVLERVATALQEVIFCGMRPVRNYHSCFIRFMGGKLHFHTGSRASVGPGGRQSWRLELPRNGEDKGSGLRRELNDMRFKYEKVSLLHHIKGHKYAPCEAVWAQLHRRSQRTGEDKAKVGHGRQRISGSLCPSSPHERLGKMLDGARGEFQGDFPTAKINLFRVYLACVEIVRAINARTDHGDGDGLCLCFADTLLRAADDYQGRRRGAQRFGERGLREACRQAFERALGSRPLSDFLWDI